MAILSSTSRDCVHDNDGKSQSMRITTTIEFAKVTAVVRPHKHANSRMISPPSSQEQRTASSSSPSSSSFRGGKYTYRNRVSTDSSASATTTATASPLLTIAPAESSADATPFYRAFIGSVLFDDSQSSSPSSSSSSSSSSPPSVEGCGRSSTYLHGDVAAAAEDEADAAMMRPPLETEYEIPTPAQIDAYAKDVLAAVRASDVDALRAIRRARGDVSLRCRNRYGEGLLHVACRRSDARVVSYLLGAGLNPLVRDDYGRTPLHDACWRGSPDFELVEAILRAEPRSAFVRDVRGHRPFEYARREHWGAWRAFLDDRRDLFVTSSRPSSPPPPRESA
ncbi:hypothetical protein ACHAW5_010641 [Stephanodiscus triporus]|uniref:Inhibitor of kappa B-like protein n=1 Tax=Stephanodiscus triporus TaxID=2934178 RepID=A0ABD3QE24_9STRA